MLKAKEANVSENDDETTKTEPKVRVEIPRRAADLKAIKLGSYSSILNWSEVYEAQKALSEDEQAARALGRRGMPLFPEWAADPEDPRLFAWKAARAEHLVDAVEIIRDWRGEEEEDRLSDESLQRIYEAARTVVRIVEALVPHPAVPREVPAKAPKSGSLMQEIAEDVARAKAEGGRS